MSKLLSLVSAFAVLAMSGHAFADQEIAQSQGRACGSGKKDSNCFEQGLPLPDQKIMKSKRCEDPANKCSNPNEVFPRAYSGSAAIMTRDSWDLNVGASFIYWYASQDDMDIAVQGPTATVGGSVLYQNFGFNPGFKVNAGWDTSFDGWCVEAQYTWLHQEQNTGSEVAPAGGGLPPATGYWSTTNWFDYNWLGDHFSEAKSTWKLRFNMVDLMLGRPYYHGHHLTVSPTGGLRLLFIGQYMNVNMTGGLLTGGSPNPSGGASATSNNHQSSWAVGPMAGLSAHWNFWKAIRFEGKLGGSVLYTDWSTIKHTETTTVASGAQATSVSSSDSLSTVRPTIDMGIGIGAGGYLYDCKYFLDFVARYDFSVFFKQNMMRYYTAVLLEGLSAGPADIGDLMFQGLTLDFNFNF
jgi:hypothetical protein